MHIPVYRLILAIILLFFISASARADTIFFPNQAVGAGGAGGATGLLNVKDYGAKGDGTTDDTVALQKAFADGIAHDKCVYLPAGQYNVTQDLNLASPGPVINHPCVIGDAPQLVTILCNDPGGNCVDLTGSDAYYLANFQLYSFNAATAPKVLLLSARGQYNNQAMADGFGYELHSIWLGASTSNTKYTWYNYGAEVGSVYDCRFGTDGNFGTEVVLSATNTAGITSRYATVVSQVPPVSPVWNTSESAINFFGGVIAVSSTAGSPTRNCGILFDNQAPPSAPANTYIDIHDIGFYGMFFGESYNGAVALCDTANPVAGSVLDHINLYGIRMEAGDANPNYGAVDFSHSYVINLNIDAFNLGMVVADQISAVNMGYFDQSLIDVTVSDGMAPGVYAINAAGARADTFKNIPPSQIASALYDVNNPGANSGNVFQWYDPAGNGHLDAGGYESTSFETLVNGSTAGSILWAMPMHATHNRRCVLQFRGYQNATATPQVIVYPWTFNVAPASSGSCPAGMVLADGSRVTLPASMAGPFSGQCFIDGW